MKNKHFCDEIDFNRIKQLSKLTFCNAQISSILTLKINCRALFEEECSDFADIKYLRGIVSIFLLSYHLQTFTGSLSV